MGDSKIFLYFFLLNLNICLGTFVMGYFLTVFNPLQKQIMHLYGWSDDMKSFYEGLVTALIPLGAILANLFSSRVLDRFGRKSTCLITDLFCILSTILTLFSLMPLLILGRFLCGIAVGVNSVLVGIYMKEINPQKYVHFFASLGGFMLNFGMVTSFIFGINTLTESELDEGQTDNWWRIMFAFPIVICLLRSSCILLFFNYESPVFLISKGRNEEALKVLKNLSRNESEDIQSTFDEINTRVEKNSNILKNLKIISILTPKYFLRFMLSVTLVFGNQYSGVNAIAFYSKTLFNNLGGSDSTANLLNGVLGAVNLISGLLIAIPLKYIGLRKTYILSCLGSAITLGMVALFVLVDVKLVSLFFIFGYYFFFSLGIGPIIFMVIPQLLPEKFVSVVFTIFWCLAFVIGLTFPMMLDSSMGVAGSFLFFAICCVLALIVNFLHLPETSGKTAEEVEALFVNANKGLIEETFMKKNESVEDRDTNSNQNDQESKLSVPRMTN